MKPALICLLILSTRVCVGQVFTIREVRDTIHLFPVIESTQRAEVAKKINKVLGDSWGFNASAKNPFGNFNVVEEADFNYEITVNNERVFGIVIQSSYASCGLHVTREIYNFDAHTGGIIDANKLFGAEGQSKLKKSLHKVWKEKLKAAAADKDNPRAEEYKACLAAADDTSELEPSEMIVGDNNIRFKAGGCLEGTEYDFQADVTTGPHWYSLGQLLPMLTTYGYSVFVSPSAGTSPVKKLMRGTVDNKYPISLTILPGTDANTLSGMIVYDRVGTPIPLEGTMSGNQFTLHECEKPNTPLSDIEVSWDGTKLTGSFTNLKSKKQMPFTASVVVGK